MPYNINAVFDPLRSLANGSIMSTYTAVGSAFGHPPRIVMFQNLTDQQMTFSTDGVTDHLTLPSNGQLVIDFSTNQANSLGFFLSKNTTIYVKYNSAPSSGSVYVTVVYGRGD